MSTTVRLDATTLLAVTFADRESRIPWASLPDEIQVDRYSALYFKLASLDNQYKNKIVENAKLYFMHKDGTMHNSSYGYDTPLMATLHAYPSLQSWNENTISYDNQPNNDSLSVSIYNGNDYPNYGYVYGLINELKTTDRNYVYHRRLLTELLNYGSKLVTEYSYPSSGYITEYDHIKHRGSSYIPYLELVFSDDTPSMSIKSCSPTSGFQPKYSANTYNWSTETVDFSIEMPTIAHSYYRYRADSSSQYTQVDCGTSLTYTMPANTISSDSFQWQVEIVDSNGHTSTSSWYTISTLEEPSTAEIVSPKNTTIVGSNINRFEWNHIISTGTAQTAADLQYSTNNGSTWTTLATVSGASTYADIPANTLSAGSYIWRVRTYNSDSVVGSWSETKPFTVIAKPTVNAVSSEQNPKPKITWQADGQQAYRVYIDDVFDSGVIFGTTSNYTLPIYLDDGIYTVNVVVQNNYGLWSNPGTAPINVVNTPGTAMTLIIYNESDGARLTWTSVPAYAFYVVYRDGIAIAKLRENEFKDYISLGIHEYFIRGIYASTKFYGLSNVVTANIIINELMITNLDTEISLSIEQNDSSFAELSIVDSVNSTSLYISAADYPINEISHFKRKYIGFNCAFVKNNANALAFRTMLGSLVCIKTPAGTSIVGNLLEQKRSENYFYEKYSCSLDQTNYEEEIQL